MTSDHGRAGGDRGSVRPSEADDATGVPQPTAGQLFDKFERAFATQHGDAARRAALMLAIADAIAAHGRIPESLVPIFEKVVAAWKAPGGLPDPDLLLRANETVWTVLEEKNGNSTSIVDMVDRTLRAFLCLTDVARMEDPMEYAGWAAEMLSAEEWPRHTVYF